MIEMYGLKGRLKVLEFTHDDNVAGTIKVPDSGRLYKPLYGAGVLVASAVVGNRGFQFTVANRGNTQTHLNPAYLVVTASQTKYLDVGMIRSTTSPGADATIPLPKDFLVNANQELRVGISSKQAGDSMKFYLVVIELFEVDNG